MVFDFLGAFGCNSITFLFPGLGYLVALHKFGDRKRQESRTWELIFYQIAAFAFLILWLFILGLYVFMTVQKATGKYDDDLSF